MAMILFLVFSLFLQGALGGLICEELPTELCSFAISSSGKRCLLETSAYADGTTEFQCKTSEVVVNNNMRDHIETDECIGACGLHRNVVGISSDSLLNSRFASKICSSDCSGNCPNVVDLYTDLALAEGVDLLETCKTLQNSPRRMMVATMVRSSGFVVSGASSSSAGPAASPLSSEEAAFSPPWAPASL